MNTGKQDSNQDNNLPQKHDPDVTLITDERGHQVTASLKLIQDIYKTLTGKSEELSEGAIIPYRLEMPDLQQLNAKMLQTFENRDILQMECQVRIVYFDDKGEKFSSFERFQLIDTSKISPIESVIIDYHLLMRLPDTSVQNYHIRIRLGSLATIIKNAKNDFEDLNVPFSIIARNSLTTIKYVDYVIAKQFMDAVSNWFSSLKRDSSFKLKERIRKYSQYVPKIFKYWGLVMAAFVVSKQMQPNINNFASLFNAILYSTLLLFCAYRLGMTLGNLIHRQLSFLYPLSYIKLNRGDQQQIDEIKGGNAKKFLISGLITIGTVLLSIFANYIYDKIKGWLP